MICINAAGVRIVDTFAMLSCIDTFDKFALRVLPASLPEDMRCAVRALSRKTVLAAGKQLECGQKNATLVYVCAGATKLVAHASEHREQVVAFHFAGDLLTLPACGPHSYSLEALVESELLTLEYEPFLEITGERADILGKLLERTTISLQRSREKTLALGRKSAIERVCSFLLMMAERIGKPGCGGVELDLPMSRRDIADSLGLTIETISRQFTHLREQGLITTRGRSAVLLLRMDELEKRSGHLSVAA